MNSSEWSKEELIAYILLFASNSNFEESNHERNVIISRVDMQTFQRIHDEFDNDNDYQSLQKIKTGLNKHNYSEEDRDILFADLKALFYSDGEFDILERNMLMYLKRILG